jgi:hypothetical protein
MLVRLELLRYQSRGSKLDRVALAIIERQTIALKALVPRNGETCSRVEAAAQETNRSIGS